MTLTIDVSGDGVRSPISRKRAAEIARSVLRSERVTNALLSITFLDRRAMARLNTKHLDHAGATDVISFGFTRATNTDPVVGDVYICPDVGRESAKARRTPVREEIARLVVHGVLHILGHDHPVDETRERSEMWRRQERILRRALHAADDGAGR
jgi:probable rRNA maturation factor